MSVGGGTWLVLRPHPADWKQLAVAYGTGIWLGWKLGCRGVGVAERKGRGGGGGGGGTGRDGEDLWWSGTPGGRACWQETAAALRPVCGGSVRLCIGTVGGGGASKEREAEGAALFPCCRVTCSRTGAPGAWLGPCMECAWCKQVSMAMVQVACAGARVRAVLADAPTPVSVGTPFIHF